MNNPDEVTPITLNTIGCIVRRTGEPQHKIAYIIDSRNIKPVARVGIVRVFSEASVVRIVGELKRIREDRYGPDDPEPDGE